MSIETTWNWNLALFRLVNAQHIPAHLAFTRFVAQDTPYLVALGLVGWWLIGGATKRRALMIAGVSLAIGMLTNLVITSTTYMPRPSAAGIGHTWLAHGPETSFPSDHATLILSIGLALMMARGLRWAGMAITLLGLATAWARVYLGVHFPLDMIASGIIALSSAIAANALSGVLDKRLFEPAERLYLRIIGLIWRRRVT